MERWVGLTCFDAVAILFCGFQILVERQKLTQLVRFHINSSNQWGLSIRWTLQTPLLFFSFLVFTGLRAPYSSAGNKRTHRSKYDQRIRALTRLGAFVLDRGLFGLEWSAMAWCDRGVQTLLATVGAFAAFSLMTIAIGTDYWLYSRAYICNSTNVTTDETQTQPKTKKGDLTHSGLWRICCIEGKRQAHSHF